MDFLTAAHVVISLVGLAAGFMVMGGFLFGHDLKGSTIVFLTFTVATSITGFVFFPIHGVTPGIILGIISLAVLAVTIFARYPKQMAGVWRPVYVVTAVLAQYFNFFVLIVQSFMKVPALHALAPTQSEPPFAIAQLVALAVFVALGLRAVIKFKAEPAPFSS